jgi:hypothetical protein
VASKSVFVDIVLANTVSLMPIGCVRAK